VIVVKHQVNYFSVISWSERVNFWRNDDVYFF